MAGENKEQDRKFTGRKLNLLDPRVWGKYNNDVKRDTKKQKLHLVSEKLRKEIREGDYGDNKMDEVEWIIEMMLSNMNNGEDKCRKPKVGRKQFSPELKKKRANVGFWKAAIKIIKGGNGSGRKLQIEASNMETKFRRDVRDINLDEAIQMLKRVLAEQREMNNRHEEAREEWQILLSGARAKKTTQRRQSNS